MPKRKFTQSALEGFFKNKLVSTDGESNVDDDTQSDATQSKQHILIDFNIEQEKCENGIDWIVLCLFDIHFTDTSSHEVVLESEVERVEAGCSASTSQIKTKSQPQSSATTGPYNIHDFYKIK